MPYPPDSPQARRSERVELLQPIEYPPALPVSARREELADAIRQHQVVIVCGETGSGKTTQLPKICLGLGRGIGGMMGHTQPRRVAARSVAGRIAHELKTGVGGAVGYKVRFNDKVSDATSIKLMTDGILLAEIQGDPQLKKYDTLIIDEAHERSLNIDFLLGYLKQLLPRRPDLKLIITSATLDAERFASHFGGAPVIRVEGRSYPVEIRYRPPQQNGEGEEPDLPQAICGALDELSIGGLRGDVLVFLPGEREIRDTAEALRKHHSPSAIHGRVEILPLFSRLSVAEQDKVFKPIAGMRRVVLATNVAETSLTVPNIAYVIDSGLARINRYSIRQKVEQLRVEKISRASASQRTGRCGRVMSGICVRLYGEDDFKARAEFTDAEIFRVSLATVILRMAALDLGAVDQFPFIEPPGARSIADGYQLLAELGAIDDARCLTPLGRELARLPLDPRIARLLLAGKQYHCLAEILVIASALSLQDPRERPAERREAADAAHQRFNDERSDFMSYVKLWSWFQEAVRHKKSNRQWATECREKFLSPLRLREWHELHQQLHAQVAEMGWLEHSLSLRGRAGEGVNTHHAALPDTIKQLARNLRKNATGAENLLWQLLRRNQVLGFGFRRQHPMGNYVLDLYCHQARLAVELDGGQHNEEKQQQHDEARTTYLQGRGLTVLRFWNNDVLQNTEGVLQAIYDRLKNHPLPNPPPMGEGASAAARPAAPLPLGEGLGRGAHQNVAEQQPATYEQIHKALLTGLLGNIGCKSMEDAHYLGAREIKFFIASGSALAKKGAKWVVAAEIMETTRLYARCVARIDPEWLEETGAHLIRRHYYDPHWEKRAAQVAAWERSTLFGLVIAPKKRVHYGPMNVVESRAIFIRQALVAGEFDTMAPFFAHNQKLIRDIEALEHKARRPDVLVDDELIFAFYDSRIPQHIHNGAAFEAWRKEAERTDPRLLYLRRDDLMRHEAAGITTGQFPPQLVMNNLSYALGYNFAPGKNDDGVTLTVPQSLINQVSAARCEYLVPGLLAEKVAQLLKTLPQKLRRHLVPVPEFAATFCREAPASETPLLQALVRYIRAQRQIDVPPDAFRLEQLPAHLLMNFRVVDEHGRQLGMSRNFSQLRGEWARSPSLTLPRGERERTLSNATVSPSPSGGGVGVGDASNPARHTSWDFGDFAETAQERRAGQQVTVFNGLADEGDAVSLRAFDTREAAQAAHRKGLVRLFMLALGQQIKFLEKPLPGLQAMAMQFISVGSQQDLLRQILFVAIARCCLMEPWPRSEKEFGARCKDAKGRLTLVAQEIARLAGTILGEYQSVQKNLQAAKARPQGGTAEKKSAGVAASRFLPQSAGFASNVSDAHAQAAQDIRAQCEWLLRGEFVARTPYERLQHVPRYLRAISMRLEKLRVDAARDARQMALMQPLQQAWQRRVAGQQGEIDERLEEFGWLLQELRVSLFAQELKTPVIVSVKRLQKMWEGL